MGRTIADMNEAPVAGSLDAINVSEFVQSVRKFNAAAKSYVAWTALGMVGNDNPAFEFLMQYGTEVDNVLDKAFPADYENTSENPVTDYLIDGLASALGMDPAELRKAVEEEQ